MIIQYMIIFKGLKKSDLSLSRDNKQGQRFGLPDLVCLCFGSALIVCFYISGLRIASIRYLFIRIYFMMSKLVYKYMEPDFSYFNS